ncbi:Smr/MutS family protein [Hwanghaeella sp.]|uniref:Smr/MutS family protein n=1 Tax=Hwanghaeella sp. TaxID=2605943 RepID=UPI003CCB7873
MSGKGKKQNKPDDFDLWLRVAEGVTPLKSRNAFHEKMARIDKAADDVVADKGPSKPGRAKRHSHIALPTPPPLSQAAKAPPLQVGSAPGVDRRTTDRLRRGKMPIEGRLDLHGHSQESAHRALNAFIDASHAHGKRCVLVVTGKGKGILQSAVPRWLNEASLRHKVLSVEYAQQKDGGTGALYVLLRRHR